ncbi:hypothetical protein HYE67_002319 [Fusarium culmorum]|uniref:Heat shock 70 kDa protein 12B n=1 Tax=Fusarium culmorum TaxID=5516 RepID=A0A7S8D172_FUSCU|nr:hypothetical protein HYE67_002319 [Fusarium culmorum]
MKLFVAVDFGETNSAVSYAAMPKTVDPKHFPSGNVQSISRYKAFPHDRFSPMRFEVPTKLLYPRGWVFRPLEELWDAPPGSINSNTSGVKTESPEPQLLWGWEVQRQMSMFTFQSNLDGTLIYRFKTLMDQSENHKEHKQDLSVDLESLSMNRSCEEKISVAEMTMLVTVHYLAKLLDFTNREIQKNLGLEADQIDATELAICVPVIWGQMAIRNMQFCMGLAARLAGFPGVTVKNKSIDNVFIVSEPEAGATWLLSAGLGNIHVGNTFVLVDAGGGTVDAQTYTVTKEAPLRLQNQAIRHSGYSCGSNALNELLFEYVLKILDEHEYLDDQNGMNREGFARKAAFHDFETIYKAEWDMFNPDNPDCLFEIPGLRFNPQDKESVSNRLTVPAAFINAIFHHVCAEIGEIVKNQLNMAHENKVDVDAVILMGGFAQSRSLCDFIQEMVREIGQMYGRTYRMLDPSQDESIGSVVDAVAAGAVVRTLNKESGPNRVAKTAYGLGVFEPYDKEVHGSQATLDGVCDPREKYVKCIQWISKIGTLMKPNFEIHIRRRHQFPCTDDNGVLTKTFAICDEIWLSDFDSKDHYSWDHEYNKDAELIYTIETDVSHLFKPGPNNPFQRQWGSSSKASRNKKRKTQNRYWELYYDLVYIIDGLNMKCIQKYEGEVLGELSFNIASALPPGAV